MAIVASYGPYQTKGASTDVSRHQGKYMDVYWLTGTDVVLVDEGVEGRHGFEAIALGGGAARGAGWNGPGLKVVILGEDAEGPSVGAVLVALVPNTLAASHDGCGPFVWMLFL